ncbi:MAG: hypothetical protein WKG03_14285, partial [Telluria sp.]
MTVQFAAEQVSSLRGIRRNSIWPQKYCGAAYAADFLKENGISLQTSARMLNPASQTTPAGSS